MIKIYYYVCKTKLVKTEYLQTTYLSVTFTLAINNGWERDCDENVMTMCNRTRNHVLKSICCLLLNEMNLNSEQRIGLKRKHCVFIVNTIITYTNILMQNVHIFSTITNQIFDTAHWKSRIITFDNNASAG